MLDEAGFRYDPTVPEPFEITRPRFRETLPAAAAVNPAFLPPVRRQGTLGSGGYVWMAYTTFQTLSQGTALFVPG